MPDRWPTAVPAFELDCLIQELPDQGTWIENVALKGPFMRRCMRRFDQPLLWIDVDGRIVAEPKLLYGMDADFAIYAVKREWNWKPVGRERMSLLKLGRASWAAMVPHRNDARQPHRRRPGFVGALGRDILARPRDYQQLLLQEVWCMLPALRTDVAAAGLLQDFRVPMARRGAHDDRDCARPGIEPARELRKGMSAQRSLVRIDRANWAAGSFPGEGRPRFVASSHLGAQMTSACRRPRQPQTATLEVADLLLQRERAAQSRRPGARDGRPGKALCGRGA